MFVFKLGLFAEGLGEEGSRGTTGLCSYDTKYMSRRLKTRTKLRYCEAIEIYHARFDSDVKNKLQFISCILR